MPLNIHKSACIFKSDTVPVLGPGKIHPLWMLRAGSKWFSSKSALKLLHLVITWKPAWDAGHCPCGADVGPMAACCYLYPCCMHMGLFSFAPASPGAYLAFLSSGKASHRSLWWQRFLRSYPNSVTYPPGFLGAVNIKASFSSFPFFMQLNPNICFYIVFTLIRQLRSKWRRWNFVT